MQHDTPLLWLPPDILQHLAAHFDMVEYAQMRVLTYPALRQLTLRQFSVHDTSNKELCSAPAERSLSAAGWLVKHWRAAQQGSLSLSLVTDRPCAALQCACEEAMQPTTLSDFLGSFVPDGRHALRHYLAWKYDDLSHKWALEKIHAFQDRLPAGHTLEECGCCLLTRMPHLSVLRLSLGKVAHGMALRLSQQLQHLHAA